MAGVSGPSDSLRRMVKGRVASQSLTVPSTDAVARSRGSDVEEVEGLGCGWKRRAVRASVCAVVVETLYQGYKIYSFVSILL